MVIHWMVIVRMVIHWIVIHLKPLQAALWRGIDSSMLKYAFLQKFQSWKHTLQKSMFNFFPVCCVVAFTECFVGFSDSASTMCHGAQTTKVSLADPTTSLSRFGMHNLELPSFALWGTRGRIRHAFANFLHAFPDGNGFSAEVGTDREKDGCRTNLTLIKTALWWGTHKGICIVFFRECNKTYKGVFLAGVSGTGHCIARWAVHRAMDVGRLYVFHGASKRWLPEDKHCFVQAVFIC